MGVSSLVTLAQERQPVRDRESVERERATQAAEDAAKSPASERMTFERDVMTNPQIATAGGDFVFLATEMSFGGKLVKGAPYSAQAVTETVQTFTDGNRIINKSSAAVYRDSQGRTRREQTLKAIGPFASGGEPPVTVFINDPVAGTSYTLDTRTQTAHKLFPTRFRIASTSKQTTDELKAAVDSKGAEVRVLGGDQVMLERSTAAGSQPFKIAIESGGNDKRLMEAGVAMGMTSARNRNARTESLGKQNIGGVEAEGTRTIVTIPAGDIGNERAIEIVSERWYSPELQVIVMTRHSDPRFGENSYQLTNISRSEPEGDLFEVPANYVMKEPTAAAMGVGGSGIGTGVGGGVGAGASGGLNGGVLNGKAISLPLPEYPILARQAKASGTVMVQVTIDEEGNVISAESVSGHPLLRAAAVTAARQARFSPTRLSGQPVKVTGVVTYNFVAQ